jgi:regulator of replication initiation timing
VIRHWLAAMIRSSIHGKNLEIWNLTASVRRLLDENTRLRAEREDDRANLAENRRTIAALRSDLVRLSDFVTAPIDSVPEEWTP